MNNRELAGRLRTLLTPEETWWDGKQEWHPGKLCLGQALGMLVPSDWYGREYNRLTTAADRLFPKEGAVNNITWFNDHATYAEIMQVIDFLKEMPDEEESLA